MHLNQLETIPCPPVHGKSVFCKTSPWLVEDCGSRLSHVSLGGITPSSLLKILKEVGIPDHLTCLLRNLYAAQEATVRTGHGTTDWFQLEKGVCQGCILSPCLFNFYAEYTMRNAGLEEEQVGIKRAGRNVNTSDI